MFILMSRVAIIGGFAVDPVSVFKTAWMETFELGGRVHVYAGLVVEACMWLVELVLWVLDVGVRKGILPLERN